VALALGLKSQGKNELKNENFNEKSLFVFLNSWLCDRYFQTED